MKGLALCLAKQKHPFHLVKLSPSPILTAFGAFGLLHYIANNFHATTQLEKWVNPLLDTTSIEVFNLLCSHLVSFWWLPILIWGIVGWFADIIKEANIERQHTLKVRLGLRLGMVLFIVSEVFFFLSFFWAFFHNALTPGTNFGGKWPSYGLHALDPFGLPLLNTIILLSSGVSVTWAHRAILASQRVAGCYALVITVFFGVLFTICQLYEYIHAPFSINDGVYGSIFYVATGFHGAHVLIGTIFLLVCTCRLYLQHFTSKIHFGFEAAAWYWHFVDVVWLFLFVSIYWWGE